MFKDKIIWFEDVLFLDIVEIGVKKFLFTKLIF